LKRIFIVGFISLLSLCLFSEQIAEQAVVINIEVPVRVFQDGNFIENLSIDDFELWEEGIRQKIEAVYLVKNKTVERSEEKKRFLPSTERFFFLFFEISEYSSQIGEAVDYFYDHVLAPGDNLIIVTPMNTYMLRNRVLEFQSRKELSNQLKELLRNETLMGNAEYRGAVQDLVGLASSLATAPFEGRGNETSHMDEHTISGYGRLPFEKQLMKYMNTLERIRKLRRVDQQKLLDFAKVLKNETGQKYVFLIYQREYIPQLEQSILNKFLAMYQDKPHIVQGLYDMTEASRRTISFDVDLVKQVYADSSISIHFLFLTPAIQHVQGVYFQERSEDIYGAFREMAYATGGFVDSSANPVSSFKRAVDASANYYLLYYSPREYAKDGQFKEIKVGVKEGDYKVVHRMGYFSN
jgi:VWFA-related protein